MKLIISYSIVLALIFVGCSKPVDPEEDQSGDQGDSQNLAESPQNSPDARGVESDSLTSPLSDSQNVAELQAGEIEPEMGVVSQTVLTCSKEGAEDIVYIAKTYETSVPCQHARATGKLCLCEVLSEDEFFSNQNGVYLFATGTASWCEGEAIDSIEQNQGVVVIYGVQEETKFIQAAHDASYTCLRS